MKSTRNHKQPEPLYKPMLHDINPSWVAFLQSELDKALATIKRMREDYQTLEARFKTATIHWGQQPGAVIAERERQIRKLKDENTALKAELKRLTQPRRITSDWSQMKQADTELLPLGKGNIA